MRSFNSVKSKGRKKDKIVPSKKTRVNYELANEMPKTLNKKASSKKRNVMFGATDNSVKNFGRSNDLVNITL